MNKGRALSRAGKNNEAYVSTEPSCPQAPSRLPFAHGDEKWPSGSLSSPGKGPQASERLTGPTHAAVPVMTGLDTQLPPQLMKTLKKRSEFLAVAKGGRVGRRAFLLQGLKRETDEPPRVGYTVTKKTGNSVVRSRIKRRLRAAVAALESADIPPKADFVLVGREAALSIPFQNLVSDLKSGLPLALDPKSGQHRRKPRAPNGKPVPETASSRKQG